MGDGRGFWSVCLFLFVLVGFGGSLFCRVEMLFCILPSTSGLLSGFACLCFLWAVSGPCCVLGAQEF